MRAERSEVVTRGCAKLRLIAKVIRFPCASWRRSQRAKRPALMQARSDDRTRSEAHGGVFRRLRRGSQVRPDIMAHTVTTTGSTHRRGSSILAGRSAGGAGGCGTATLALPPNVDGHRGVAAARNRGTLAASPVRQSRCPCRPTSYVDPGPRRPPPAPTFAAPASAAPAPFDASEPPVR